MFLEVFENNNFNDNSWALGSHQMEPIENLMRELAGECCRPQIFCFIPFSKCLHIKPKLLLSRTHGPIQPSPS